MPDAMLDRLVVTREKPQVAIGFLTEQNVLLADNSSPAMRRKSAMPLKGGGEVKNINADVLSVHTTKDMSNPAGTFRVELVEDPVRYKTKYGFEWEHILRPNTLMWIDLQRPGLPEVRSDRMKDSLVMSAEDAGRPRRVMVGFVDTVSYTESMSGGKPQRRITVQGRDAGKFLVNAEIRNSLAISFITQSQKETFSIAFKDIKIGRQSVAQIIESYWTKKLFSNKTFEQQIGVGDGLISFSFGPPDATVKTSDLFHYHMSTPGDVIFAIDKAAELRFDGNYFNMFKKFTGVPFNEIFVDTRIAPEHNAAIRPEDMSAKIGADQMAKIHSDGEPAQWNATDVPVSSDKATSMPSALFPEGYPIYATLFVRPNPWPWRGDQNYRDMGSGGKGFLVVNRNKPSKVLSPAPDISGRERWDSLPLHVVQPEDVVGYTRGRNDLEVFNWFWCQDEFYALFTQSGANDTESSKGLRVDLQYAVNPPIFYRGLVKRYGVKFLELQNPFFHTKSMQDHAFRYTRRLADYYCFNWLFWSGSITVKGNPNIRIGEKVHVLSDDREYYVESVAHDFQVFGQFTTTLGITRGAARGFWGHGTGKGPWNVLLAFDAETDAVIADRKYQLKAVQQLKKTGQIETYDADSLKKNMEEIQQG